MWVMATLLDVADIEHFHHCIKVLVDNAVTTEELRFVPESCGRIKRYPSMVSSQVLILKR